MAGYRGRIVDALVPHFERDSRYILLVGDMGFGAIDMMWARMRERVINCGIMEQGSVGIAAGMAMSGLIPVFYTIVNFLAYRCLEQVRNDVVLQGVNVKFIGTGANDAFRKLGRSHCCGEDDIRLLELVGLKVYDPYRGRPEDFPALVERWIADPAPGYFRV